MKRGQIRFADEAVLPTGSSSGTVASNSYRREGGQPGSYVDNPNTTTATGLGAAKTGAGNAASVGNDMFGRQATSDMYNYALYNEDYAITPEEAFTRYNTTGIGTKDRRKLSRLVDALNARKWGTTAAALGATGEGNIRNQNQTLWVDMPMPMLDTAESRGQKRVEGYESAAAQTAISRSDFLKRLAPQLEHVRNTLKTQFGANLDNSQVKALDSAINLFYTEKLQEFSHKELIRHALHAADTMRSLPLDSQKMLFASIMQLPIFTNAMQIATDEAGKAYEFAMQHGTKVTPEMKDTLNTVSTVLNAPYAQSYVTGLAQQAGLTQQAVSWIKNGLWK